MGTFNIPLKLIEQFPAFVNSILADKFIIRAEMSFCKQAMVYEAYSEDFEGVAIYEELPYYDLQFQYTVLDIKQHETMGCNSIPTDWSLVKVF